jgi:hypothetical protein
MCFWLTTHSPQPIAKRSRLRQLINIQHGTQRLIIMNVANIVQMKAAFMLL